MFLLSLRGVVLPPQIQICLVFARTKHRLVDVWLLRDYALTIFTVNDCLELKVDVGFEFTEAVLNLLVQRSFLEESSIRLFVP